MVNDALGELAHVRSAFHTPTLRLLHQEHAPVVVAILRTAFTREQTTIPGTRLYALVDTYLDDLRAAGETALPTGTGRDLALRWMRGTWLERDQDSEGAEIYSLTSYAQDALNIVARLTRERGALSEHRIATIIDAVRRFNASANPSRPARIQVLNDQIRELEERRAALEAGDDMPELTADSLADGYGEILSLLSALPSDFARVTESYTRLRTDILTSFRAETRPAGQIIDEYLSKVDNLQSATAEGRAFQGAFALLRDEALLMQLRRDIEDLLAHPMADDILIPADRKDLRSTVTVIDRGMDAVLTQRRRVTATLREYITTRNVTHDRELDTTLRRLDAAIHHWMSTTGPRTTIDLDLMPGKVEVDHLRERFHDPAQETTPPPLQDATDHRPATTTLSELLAQGGPTMDALNDHLTQALNDPAGPTTLGQVFDTLGPELRRPVEILGLLHLAANTPGLSVDPGPGDDLTQDLYRTIRPDNTTRTLLAPRIRLRPQLQEPQ